MASPLPVCDQATGPAVEIHVTGPHGVELTHRLVTGDALVVGSNPACGVRLPGDDVAGMHCTLSFEDGNLVVDDWDTGSGTYVNGTRVARQAVVPPAAEIAIGAFRLTTCLSTVDASDGPPEPVATPAVRETIVREEEHSAETVSRLDETGHAADDVWDSPAEDFDTPGSAANVALPAYDHGRFDDDAEGHLQIEVEFLRTELAQREARIAELEMASGRKVHDADDDLPSREEVETLVSRLEDLLIELEQSDERLKAMAELLRVSDEANLAAEEERSQMESWIGEVERRVRQWEGEWHAERDSLNKHIAEVTAQRDTAESRGTDPAQADLIRTLREQVAALQSQLGQTYAERDELQARLENAEVQSIEERVAAAVDDALREERLQISQMKAEFARDRARIVQEQEEMLSQQGLLTAEPNVADIRIRAFREHLKEIRATEPAGRPAPTMSQRLGKLWRKIEGKPLDTD